jgi:hypothetical protein
LLGLKTIMIKPDQSTMLRGANSISGTTGRDGRPPEVIEDSVRPMTPTFDGQPIKETP